MSTLLTVGYGDIYPITNIGKLMAIVIAFLGVGVVAIPTGIISAGFVEMYRKDMASENKLRDIEKIGEILVDETSSYAGLTVGEMEKTCNARVYLVIRRELTVVAEEELVIAPGDILIVQSENLRKRQR
jgi:voltage-gated potassium channel